MKTRIFFTLIFLALLVCVFAATPPSKPIRILVVTGGHEYNIEKFNKMLASLGDEIKYQVAELPAAYDMFLPENRNKYDVLCLLYTSPSPRDRTRSRMPS